MIILSITNNNHDGLLPIQYGLLAIKIHTSYSIVYLIKVYILLFSYNMIFK